MEQNSNEQTIDHMPSSFSHQPCHCMNVNFAWPSDVALQGQKSHVLCGRVCARTRTAYSPLVSSAAVAKSGMRSKCVIHEGTAFRSSVGRASSMRPSTERDIW